MKEHVIQETYDGVLRHRCSCQRTEPLILQCHNLCLRFLSEMDDSNVTVTMSTPENTKKCPPKIRTCIYKPSSARFQWCTHDFPQILLSKTASKMFGLLFLTPFSSMAWILHPRFWVHLYQLCLQVMHSGLQGLHLLLLRIGGWIEWSLEVLP